MQHNTDVLTEYQNLIFHILLTPLVNFLMLETQIPSYYNIIVPKNTLFHSFWPLLQHLYSPSVWTLCFLSALIDQLSQAWASTTHHV